MGRSIKKGPFIDTVAIARQSQAGDTTGLALYRNGVELPQYAWDEFTSLAASTNGARLYCYNGWTTEFGFRRMNCDSNGLTMQDFTQGLITGYGVSINFEAG